MKTHLRADVLQRTHLEVRRPHPCLEGAEGVFDGLPADAHLVRIVVKTLLHRLEHVLMLPAFDATFWRRRALRLERTSLAS